MLTCTKGMVCIIRFVDEPLKKEGLGCQKNKKIRAGFEFLSTRIIESVGIVIRRGGIILGYVKTVGFLDSRKRTL